MATSRLGRGPTVPALLLVVAAAYCLRGMTCAVELSDEGHIVYASWRTAAGMLPYRDFHHIYGPSLFFLNGGLLRLFGPDLWVMRLALLGVKAVTALLVYLAARRAARPALALAAYAATLVVIGTPVWLFAAPYANHYALPLVLGGLLAVLTLPRRRGVACLVAGLCFGVAATFKQTTGIFAAIALAWFLVYERSDDGAPEPTRLVVGVARLTRLLVLAGALAVLVRYTSATVDWWTDAVLLAPAVATTVLLTRLEIAAPPTAADAARSLRDLVACGLGMAVPVVGYGIAYGSAGALGPMLDDLFRVLPWKMQAFAPFPAPTLRTASLVAGTVIAFAILGRLERGARTGVRALVAAGLACAAVAAWSITTDPLRSWGGVVLPYLYWLPLALVWATLPLLWRARPGGRTAPLALFSFWGVVGLVHLYPSADFWHLLMGLPVFFVLLAAAGASLGAGTMRIALAGVVLAAVLEPSFANWAALQASAPAPRAALARATHLADPRPKFRDTVALVDYLTTPAARDQAVFVLASAQMIYFLVDRPSPVEQDEFLLFLVASDLIRPADARAALDQGRLTAAIAATRPLVIDDDSTDAGRRVRSAFPELAAYLDRTYHVVARFGPYSVLAMGT